MVTSHGGRARGAGPPGTASPGALAAPATIAHMDHDDEDDLPPPPIGRLGPCGLCGWHPDQRHRIRDAIFDRLVAGDGIEDICRDYEWTVDQVRALYYDVDVNLVEMIRGTD